MNVCENVFREGATELGAAPKRLLRRRQMDQEEHEIEECGNGRTALIEASENASVTPGNADSADDDGYQGPRVADRYRLRRPTTAKRGRAQALGEAARRLRSRSIISRAWFSASNTPLSRQAANQR